MKTAIENTVSVVKGVSTLDLRIKTPSFILLLLIWITAFGGAVRAGHSTLDLVDPTFRPLIQTTTLQPKTVQQIIPLPNGKALVAGNFNSYNRQPTGAIVRLNADGTLDTTFNSNLSGDGAWLTLALQTDGKIVVLVVWDYENFYFLRLNADGSPDPTFNVTFGPYDTWVSSFTIDANDRIIVNGIFYENFPNDYRSIIRLNPDGSRDPTFQFPLNQTAGSVGTQNNKIIIRSQAGTQWQIKRLNEDGTLDPSFITRNFDGWTLIVQFQPDGKILIQTSPSESGPYTLRRLNENGSDDTGFTSATFPFWVYLSPGEDGRIALAVRIQTSSDYQIKRLLADGTVDGSFTPYIAARFSALAQQADSSVLIGDKDLHEPPVAFRNDFVRLLPNGSPDPNYLTGIGFQNYFTSGVSAIHVQPDQKILIGGGFNHVNDIPRRGIARLNTNSTLDESFQINTSGTGNYFFNISYFSNIITQSDGKIVATGSFEYWVNSTTTRRNLVRLNSDGSIDPTFIIPDVWLREDGKLGIFNDGKLLVGNSRGTEGVDPPPVPLKLLANGARDTSFNANIYPQDPRLGVADVAIQPDGKILIGGGRGYPVNRSYLTRLNPDGSLDTTFQTRELPDTYLTSFVLLPDGKIVVAEYRNVLRLNPDGSVDPTFQTGVSAPGGVNTLLLLPTGRILAGGWFQSFNGQPRGNLVQLNEDGSVFSPVYNVNGAVSSLAVDASGRVFVGGDFTTIIVGGSGGPRTSIAGLIDSARFDFNGDGRADLATYSATDGLWSILNSQNYQTTWTNFGLSGDKTVAADYDGDGKTDYAVFRPADGTWWYLNVATNAVGAVQWGINGDKPVTGDFDGDGKADFAVWRPSSGDWWVLNSSNGGAAVINFGLAGDMPLSHADLDGDGKTDIAVWRPSNGNFYWLASGSDNQFTVVHFGTNGDIPAVADYNGDGKTDLAVYRPSQGNWYQYLTMSNGQYTFAVVGFGLAGDTPVPADYDGDGKTDLAIRRGNEWHVLHSSLGYSIQTFGDPNSHAVAAMPMP